MQTRPTKLAAVLVVGFLVGCEQQKQPTQQTSAPATGSEYAFLQGYPTADAAQKANDDADFGRAVQAYRFWYPTVSNEGIFQGNRKIGIQDNVNGGYVAA